MKTIINNSNVNPCTITYAELKKLVPSTTGQKLPTAKRLKETGEILFSVQDGATLMHIHDELVIEAPEGTSLEEICNIMGRTPPWAEGLNLRADGYVTPWYKKD